MSVGIMASAVVRTVTNLLRSDAQASWEDGTTAGYSLSAATAANATTQARHGTHSLALTNTGLTYFAQSPTITNGVPVTPGIPHTLMASLWLPAGLTGITYQLLLLLWDAGGAALTTLQGPQVAMPVLGDWADVRWLTSALVPTAAWGAIRCTIRNTPTGAGHVTYYDRFGIFTGDVPSTSWTLPSQPALG